MYAQYQIFVGIMKFDVFFFVAFCLQLIALVLKDHDWEYYVTYVALPFSILVLVDGMLAARYENTYMMLSFMLGCGGAMVYFVYKVWLTLLFLYTSVVHSFSTNSSSGYFKWAIASRRPGKR